MTSKVENFSKIKINSFDLTDMKYITHGFQGVILKGKYRGIPVAVKKVNWAYDENTIRIMRKAQHENVVELLYYCEDPFWLIMPLYDSTLWKIIHDVADINGVDFYRYIKQIAAGMQCLHECGIVHRDLKSENVLLTKDLNVKICDFESSKEVYENNLRSTLAMNTVAGTELWMAPEIGLQQTYKQSVDVWSFAVVAWEMVTQKTPYDSLPGVKNSLPMLHNLQDNLIRLPFPCGITSALRRLLISCQKSLWSARPTFNDIVNTLSDVKIDNNVWAMMKPKWRTMQLNFTYSNKAAQNFKTSEDDWKTFNLNEASNIQQYLADANSADDQNTLELKLKLIDRSIGTMYTDQQRLLMQTVIKNEASLELKKGYEMYEHRIVELQRDRERILKMKPESFTDMENILSNLTADAAWDELYFLAHQMQCDQVQNEAILPCLLRKMASNDRDIVRKCCEILAIEPMRNKLNLEENLENAKILMACFEGHVNDAYIVKCLLVIFNSLNTTTKVHDFSPLVKPIMQFLEKQALFNNSEIWSVRKCWEILAEIAKNENTYEILCDKSGLDNLADIVAPFPVDHFIQGSFFKILYHSCYHSEKYLLTTKLTTKLCDYIDHTNGRPFLSFDAVAALIVCLTKFPEKPRSDSIHADNVCIEKVTNAIQSWEFGEGAVDYRSPAKLLKPVVRNQQLAHLFSSFIYADAALPNLKSSHLTNDDDALIKQIQDSARNDANIKLLMDIALEAWKQTPDKPVTKVEMETWKKLADLLPANEQDADAVNQFRQLVNDKMAGRHPVNGAGILAAASLFLTRDLIIALPRNMRDELQENLRPSHLIDRMLDRNHDEKPFQAPLK